MKGSIVILDHIAGRRAAARLVDGQVEDLLVDPPADGPPVPGTIYRARVDRAIKGLGGVFLRLPDGMAFLRGRKDLAPGDSTLVQVTGYAEPGKAVPVTHKLLFKSKFAIVTPGAPGLNLSRRIRDEELRVRLKTLASDLMQDSSDGLILRSDASDAAEEELTEDIAEMRALAETISPQTEGEPQRLLDGPDAHALAWREWGTPDSIVTDPGGMADHGVLDALQDLDRAGVSLPDGGRLYVEPTRALVAVDVNTGGDQSPAAGLKANLAAAANLPRALRLLGLGGQITVDCAPLAKKDRRVFEQALRRAFNADPVDTTLIGWTPLGHFEAQRKRERLPLDGQVRSALQ